MRMDLPKENSSPHAHQFPVASEVQEELERVLGSSAFRATPRRKKLLRYLVEESLAGRGRELKGYTIATLVFERDESFDPQADPVVRLEARRLRHDLDSYYVSHGRKNPVRISIPKGQYVPLMEWGNGGSAADDAASIAADNPEAHLPKTADGTSSIFFRRASIAAGVSCILLLAAFILVFFNPLQSRKSNATENGTAIAVIPFHAESADATPALLANGMADEIMGGINRFGVFRLYMPSGGGKGLSGSDPLEIGKRLNLDYVVSGTLGVDDTADTLRVNARLIDVHSQRILWMGSYDRNYSTHSLQSVQREIASAVASALGQPYGVLRTDESVRTADADAADMSSYQCVLRSYTYRRTFDRPEHDAVLPCLEKAVQRDPNYAEAWAMLAWLYMDEGRFGWTADGNQDGAYRRALTTAQHAISLDHNNVSALKTLASTEHYMGNYAESARVQRLALALNPIDPDTLAQLGWRLAVRGNFEEGIPYLRQAIERSINPPGWYYHLIAIDQYLKGQYQEMLETAQRSVIDGSGISWSFVAIAEGALGDEDQAHAALEKMAKISPLLARDPADIYRRHQATDSIVDALVAGLRKAGWSETPPAKNPA